MFQNRFELIRSSREIKKPVAAGAAFLVDLVETFRQRFVTGLVFELALVIEDRLGKGFPDFIAHSLARKFPSRFFEFSPKFVVTFLPSRKPDDCDGGRQIAISGEVVECRNKFALGEIAGRAEDDNCARLWHSARR